MKVLGPRTPFGPWRVWPLCGMQHTKCWSGVISARECGMGHQAAQPCSGGMAVPVPATASTGVGLAHTCISTWWMGQGAGAVGQAFVRQGSAVRGVRGGPFPKEDILGWLPASVQEPLPRWQAALGRRAPEPQPGPCRLQQALLGSSSWPFAPNWPPSLHTATSSACGGTCKKPCFPPYL